MQSEPSSSSPKRAASEDPSQDNIRASQSQGLSSLSIHDSDVNAYMTEQGEDASATTPAHSTNVATPSSEQKFSQVEALIQSPMHVGETWYVVSNSWYRRWRKVVSKEVHKEGPVDEKDVGPVDNTDIVGAGGEEINQSLGLDDYVFVPEQVWVWFTEWYGKARHELPRKVIARGVQNEPTLELHPLRLKAHILTSSAVPGVTRPPRFVTVSVQDTMDDLYKTLANPSTIASRMYRIWRLVENDSSLDQVPCTPKQLKQCGATQIQPSSRKVGEELIEPGDSFVVEFQEDGIWVVDSSEVTPRPVFDSQSTVTQSTPKLFGPDSEFFGQFLANASSTSVSNVTSSPAKPVLSNMPDRIGSSAVVPRSKGGGSEPGTLGLGNMGNTCFMNSALQCLVHTPELADYFLTGVFREELNPDNPLGMGGAIAQAFGALLQRIWTTGSGSTSYSPREFKQALQRFAPQFSGYQQHDSQELVAFLLDGLHEDLNRVLKKPYVEKPDWEGGGDKELVGLANESWQGYMKRNDSVIVDLFQGQYQSTLVCPECSKVSITFDPFMYLTLPLPIQKKWRHDIYYIPWDMSKPHVKVPIEINRDASFKELRQLLGRWVGAEPDHLLTLEVFSHRFYKDLDDTVLVGDMADNDIIVCFELPCHGQQNRSHKPSSEDPFIIPVMLCDTITAQRSYGRNQNLFGYPFVVVITHQQATDPDAIYDAVADRLQRWVSNVPDLFSWEAGSPSMESVHIPIAGPSAADSLTEITPNGDVITVHEEVPEEGDITDEKGVVVRDEGDMDVEIDGEPRKVGFKRNIFKIYIQACNERHGTGMGVHYASGQRFDTFEQRLEMAKRVSGEDSTSELLQEGDAFLCEFDQNMKDYYFGDDRLKFDQTNWSRWKEFVHPEYTASREAAAAKKTRGISLQDCLDEFTKEEKLGEDDLWYCPRCKKHQQATKRFDLWKVPDILVVHLKRFSNSRTLRDKIDVLVDFPVEGLDISSMVGERQVAQRLSGEGVDLTQLGLSDNEEPLVYDLYGVDEHMGGLGGGHYRAYAYNHVTEKWYHFDDSYVTPVRAEASVNPNAYLLFYRRRTNRPIGGKSHDMIEVAKQKLAVSQPKEEDAVQLPTPPSEADRLVQDEPILPWPGPVTETETPTNGWPTPQSNAHSSPASSPPPLDDGDPPSFEEAQYDDLVQTPLDPLVLLTAQQFAFPDPTSSSRNSPTSSVEAEPDPDLDKDAMEGWLGKEAGERFVSLDEIDGSVARKIAGIAPFVTRANFMKTHDLPASDDETDSSAAVEEASSAMSDIDV
ncbi:cysteine proteinase [Daedalea quercina L-15889]|uniref:ubiquitinyl hydrolase 1 n=1 Tax=Daedalea quercina L-15889 TaxID=1314783 RepID=A0A165KRZ4_9APHY|nr:cysteine proteinase [Daedalea quercina L-15889]